MLRVECSFLYSNMLCCGEMMNVFKLNRSFCGLFREIPFRTTNFAIFGFFHRMLANLRLDLLHCSFYYLDLFITHRIVNCSYIPSFFIANIEKKCCEKKDRKFKWQMSSLSSVFIADTETDHSDLLCLLLTLSLSFSLSVSYCSLSHDR